MHSSVSPAGTKPMPPQRTSSASVTPDASACHQHSALGRTITPAPQLFPS